MADQSSKIQELLSRIEQNERVRDTAKHMRRLLTDRNALSQCDTEIKKAQMYIDYFTDEVHKLKNRSGKSATEEPLNTSVNNQSSGSLSTVPTDNNASNAKKRYSTLDLLTTNTPYNKPKVSLKLHELEYKLDVEKKVLDGTKTLADALDRQPVQSDRKQRDEIKSQMYESIEKLGLLNRALRKYKGLYIGEGEEEDEDYELETPPSARLPPGFRRPVTGKLQLEILEARELAHAPTRMIRSPETTVYIKIDGNIVFRSKPSRNGRWLELCEIHVNKASEVEVAIYDHDAERNLPIGMFWLRITDIADGLRKRKIQQDNGQGWAPADVTGRHHQHGADTPSASGKTSSVSSDQQRQSLPPPPLPKSTQVTDDGNGIQAWFDVEPVGEMSLRLNFVRESANRRPLDKLGRAGAVRQRPEAIHEMNGHQFVEKKFYNVMKCALCGDFLVNSGYQCEDCVYTCHRKCYTKVVTKCISKSEKDVDEDKLNHKIPHRFEPITNIGANWCCHCGYMLSLGSRSAKKCSECGITCHIKCSHLVPDFCGLSMEMANQMLAEIKAARRKTGDGSNASLLPGGKTGQGSKTDGSGKTDEQLSNQLSQVNIGSEVSPSPSTSTSANPYAPIPNTARLSGSNQAPSLPSKDGVAPALSSSTSATTAVSTTRQVTLDDFSFLAVLGKGNFGKVMLAEDRHDQNLYAVKVLKKRFILDNDEMESLRSEKRIFQAANREHHPFLVGLHSCFQTESRVYFVMEYVNGGDLMWHIQREPFSERRAKFYACEVLLALEYFHSLGIIYRDLKLDNIMLGLDGHIKVADYGLCKEGMFYGNNTATFCGTPEFMSPEILLEQRYGRAVDWWAFGVLIYEMLLGQSPFRGEDEDEIFDAILEDDILYPINMSRDSVSICQRLLTRDPAHRLGAGPDDAADIRAHPFFRGVNWDDMLAKRVPPPFYPTVNGRLDTSNFDEQFTAERPALTPIPGGMARAEQQEFVQFSYVADWATTE
ncbi:kinase-like domain-containing protein [Absidia repens]|uniref:protein kinase C n=1 Tax=Absidia repens TaxID=90262 RepID=A0A1X2HZX2_9FUNG|nr:kinase-like domain-containing protein [Absidia repens]